MSLLSFRERVEVMRWIGTFLLLVLGSAVLAREGDSQPNVLFIVVDDLNDWTTVYDPDNPIKTPNLTFQLAQKGGPDQGRNENDPDDWHNLAADPKPEHEQVMAGLRKWFPAREVPQVADMRSSNPQEQQG